MKVFITGGSGFVGYHLIQEVLKQGWQPVCLVRRSSRTDHLQNLPLQLVVGDLQDSSTFRAALKNCSLIFHCAADYRFWAKNRDEIYSNNVAGTNNVLSAAYDEGIERIIYTSTVGSLAASRNGHPANESTKVDLADMIGDYKRSKFLAERTVDEWISRGLNVVIVNPSTPVGEFDIKPTPTGKMILDFLRGKMFAYVDSGMNLVDVQDVAAGHVLAAIRGKTGEKYILGNRNLTLKEIFDLLSQISGISSPRFKIPHWIALGYAGIENFWSIAIARKEPQVPAESVRMAKYKMWFDSSKAVHELGLPQNPVEKALDRAVCWFRENGYVH